MKYFNKLEGERLYLSPRNVEDVEIFVKWMNDFNVTDYIGRSNQVMTIDAEKKFLERNIDNEQAFSIIEKKNNKLIGTVGFCKIDYISRCATLGIFIGDDDYRNNGYGTEAIRLILDYGFNYLNLNNINLDLLEVNERAYKCYIKCGFKEYGRRRKCKFLNGKYYDCISMDILANEFKDSYIKNKNI